MPILKSLLLFSLCVLILVIIFLMFLLVFSFVISKSRDSGAQGVFRLKVLNKLWSDEVATLESISFSKKFLKSKSKPKLKSDKKLNTDNQPCLFLLRFEGDLHASGVSSLREEIRVILEVARPHIDEVLIRLESGGGVVHGYGLAAAQLARLKAKNITLNIAIDKVAASGGYMMAVVADKILAAPFSIIGSIGVILQLPNFHRFLNENGVDFEQIMAGEFKRTLTVFGKNTPKAREKVQSEVDKMQELFKAFILQHRPQLDIEAVATGEHWYGSEAFDLGLIDQVITSDEYISNMVKSKNFKVIEVEFYQKKSLGKRLGLGLKSVGYLLGLHGVGAK